MSVAKFKWPKELISVLIEEWRQQTNLYDVNHSDYLNKVDRVQSINKITNILKCYDKNIKFEDVRKKMHTIRTQHGRELRLLKRSAKASSDEKYKPTLWCFNQLKFLEDHISIKSKLHPLYSSYSEESEDDAPATDHRSKRKLEDGIPDFLRKKVTEIQSTLLLKKDEPYDWLGQQVVYKLNQLKDEELQEEVAWSIQGILKENMLKDQNMHEKRRGRYAGRIKVEPDAK